MNQVMKIANNVKKGLKTTIIGGVLIAASIASVFVLEYSWANALPGIGLGVLLMCMPDKRKSRESN